MHSTSLEIRFLPFAGDTLCRLGYLRAKHTQTRVDLVEPQTHHNFVEISDHQTHHNLPKISVVPTHHNGINLSQLQPALPFETPLSQSQDPTLLIDPGAYDEWGGALTYQHILNRTKIVRHVVADVLAAAMLDLPPPEMPARLVRHAQRYRRKPDIVPQPLPRDVTVMVNVVPRRGLHMLVPTLSADRKLITITFSQPAYRSWRTVNRSSFRSGWETDRGLRHQRMIITALLVEQFPMLLRV